MIRARSLRLAPGSGLSLANPLGEIEPFPAHIVRSMQVSRPLAGNFRDQIAQGLIPLKDTLLVNQRVNTSGGQRPARSGWHQLDLDPIYPVLLPKQG